MKTRRKAYDINLQWSHWQKWQLIQLNPYIGAIIIKKGNTYSNLEIGTITTYRIYPFHPDKDSLLWLKIRVWLRIVK